MGTLNKWYERLKDRADFKVVYVREAHPSDGWQVPQNRRDGVVYETPETYEERKRIAKECEVGLSLKIPILIDTMDDAVETAYAGWPDRIYVIDRGGKIAFRGRPGPAGFRPEEAMRALDRLLGLSSSPSF